MNFLLKKLNSKIAQKLDNNLVIISEEKIVIAYQLYNNISSKSVVSLDRVSNSFLSKNPSVLMERIDKNLEKTNLDVEDKKDILDDYILLLRLYDKDKELKSAIDSYDPDIKEICTDIDKTVVRLCVRIKLSRTAVDLV